METWENRWEPMSGPQHPDNETNIVTTNTARAGRLFGKFVDCDRMTPCP